MGIGCQGGDLRHLPPGNYLDLSTCVNRYGPPESVVEKLRTIRSEQIRIHPYAAAANLAAVYANSLNVSVDQVLAGRGTTEFIWSFSRIIDHERVMVPLPAYSDFIRAFPGRTRSAGSNVLSIDDLAKCMSEAEFVIISNPSNPTGVCLPRAQLKDLLKSYPQTLLAVDESYVDFLLDGTSTTLIGCESENLIVLRSPSKFYGIASTRTGIAWSRNKRLLKQLQLLQDTWPLSGVDVMIAAEALQDRQWAITMRKKLQEDALWLEESLAVIFDHIVKGVPVHYRFLVTPLAKTIAEQLQHHYVLTRVFRETHGVLPGGLRIACPLKHEREAFSNALNKLKLV